MTQDVQTIQKATQNPPTTKSTAQMLAITGATGFIGRQCLDMALAAGWNVRALTRRKQPPHERQHGNGKHGGSLCWIEGSLADPEALAELVRGSDCVLHIAGLVNAHSREHFAQVNVEGTSSVIAAMQAMGIERLIHISSLSVRESAMSHYGWSKAKAESLVQASGLDWTILRPAAVFGPGDRIFLSYYRMIKKGFAFVPPPGRVSIIMVSELNRLILALAQDRESSIEKIYEPDDGRCEGWTHHDFVHAIGFALGVKRVRIVTIPPPIIMLLARIARLTPGVNSEFTVDKARHIAHPNWVVSNHARPPAQLWSPAQTTEDAFTETIAWYRKRNMI